MRKTVVKGALALLLSLSFIFSSVGVFASSAVLYNVGVDIAAKPDFPYQGVR